MVNEDIVRYFEEGIKRGFSLEELKQELIRHNHSEKDVLEAINHLPRQYRPKMSGYYPEGYNPNQKMPEIQKEKPMEKPMKTFAPAKKPKSDKLVGGPKFFGKIGMSFTHPVQLFNEIKDDKKWDTLKYYLLLAIVPFLIISIVTAIFAVQFVLSLQSFIALLGSQAQVPAFLEFILNMAGVALFEAVAGMYFVFIFILGPIMSFIAAALMHLGLKIVKSKGTLTQTYNAIIYATTPGMVLAPIVFLVSIFVPFLTLLSAPALIWSLVLVIIGFAVTHEISGVRAFFGWLLGVIITLIVLSLISFILIVLFVPIG
ncbi:hypothetical protein COU62_01665 [Candidatus Pacearchaeota archaeon CG10_big_fil_rev_8_21_14_0_10_35_219]|nr:YIP1 family protein [Candidatus Pacearchaeota archaeon]OIO43142.1 MAG: hypothetical protein AUJ63_00940 [Candidatus Pacearchaeota archaeon CG1_02_35_32]PIO08071.1 MAG: hypothetical protein COU62_01665 [Candidatus Pacearchaeota archaeon CG10_big_fil_rev_8_21_14_0_10_35_219]PIY81584.1 MAG: hypothetical protein COY79_02500 [Candidatus Pacearchaeota archaeon CG_4_10_14_0_8_um_filter_35_169]PIZ78959.1 MAG: hypothetical protein COY00_04885 [Candidatus Pacearchaeota archaeon CG_4_10_14_0_2_um_filte